MLGLNAPFGHRRRHRDQVVAEDRIAQPEAGVLLPGGDDHRGIGPQRAEHHADGVAEAGRDMEIDHPGAAARLGVVARRSDGDTFVEGQHIGERRVGGETVDKRALGRARIAEQILDPVRQQALHDDVTPAHVSHPSPRPPPTAARSARPVRRRISELRGHRALPVVISDRASRPPDHSLAERETPCDRSRAADNGNGADGHHGVGGPLAPSGAAPGSSSSWRPRRRPC